MELLATNLYSDYAHHPAEIEATIQIAQELKKPIVVVYQPNQNLRQHVLKSDYAEVFKGAEVVYWLPTTLSREPKDLRIIEPEELIREVQGTKTEVAEISSELWQNIMDHKNEQKTVVLMNAGNLDAWARTQLETRN
eukprot:m.345139 g.345139  ORF g.345139 m.345139 type:complete len:137 (-) comp25777_c0_seq1:28-438(-)